MRVRFKVGDVFFVGDELSRFVAGLGLVTNDMGIVNEGIVRESRGDPDRNGQSMHWFYHACSVYREAVRYLHFASEAAAVQTFLDGLPAEAREAYQKIKASGEPWGSSFVDTKLFPLRNLTFHYPKVTELDAPLTQIQEAESGIYLGSGTTLETRYGFADDIRAQVAVSILGETTEELAEVMQTTASLVGAWLRFAHGATSLHLQRAGLDKFTVQPSRPKS